MLETDRWTFIKKRIYKSQEYRKWTLGLILSHNRNLMSAAILISLCLFFKRTYKIIIYWHKIHTKYFRRNFLKWQKKKSSITWRTEAPLWRNWRPLSAESIPPVAKMGNPGKARAMAVTALKAMGLIAVPIGNKNDQWLIYWPPKHIDL